MVEAQDNSWVVHFTPAVHASPCTSDRSSSCEVRAGGAAPAPWAVSAGSPMARSLGLRRLVIERRGIPSRAQRLVDARRTELGQQLAQVSSHAAPPDVGAYLQPGR